MQGENRFGVLPERGGLGAERGDAVIEVAKRGGHDTVRPRHPVAPLRTAFAGTPAYAPDPLWVVTGRYRAFDEPRPTTVGPAVEVLEHVYDAPGRVEFELDGRPLALTAFPGHGAGRLLVQDRAHGWVHRMTGGTEAPRSMDGHVRTVCSPTPPLRPSWARRRPPDAFAKERNAAGWACAK
ncbi:Protein of unknown function [Streptomyces mirabilis]|uniref:Uncharacterized protein n=1 Tax=Streptomyces mirabilis TaxID=68239 RepID=A0A1I2L236_9ACTN|nr:Protein of unknown function [Streptomyces mirabilis]